DEKPILIGAFPGCRRVKLRYMSTNVVRPTSAVALSLGQLHRWQPARPIPHRVAEVCLGPEAADRIQEPWKGAAESLRWQTMAALDQFIEHGHLWPFDPCFGKTAIVQLKILSP